MKPFTKLLSFGFLVWLIPFAVSVVIYPLKQTGSPLFETIMPVTLTLVGVVFSVLYFKPLKANYIREGWTLGVAFLAISIALDLLLFMWGPMKMTFGNYVIDIGLTYLIYPIITVGFGYLLVNKL
ncbi:MAG: hypothetical protein AAB342_03980 [Chloroflexota bacterium]